MSSNDARLARNTVLTVLALVALRLVAAAWTPLTFDEAYYWMWSKHLAGGYYDHPPAGRVRDPRRHHDRGRHRTRRAAGLDPAGAADELCGVSRRRHPVRRHRGWPRPPTILLNVTLMAAVGTMIVTPDAPLLVASSFVLFFLAKVLETGRGAWWLAVGAAVGCRAAVEIHRAVFRPGDPDLAGRGAETAALADLALALSRRPGGAGGVCAGHSLERRSPLGLLPQADVRPRPDREFPAGLHRRTDSDPDRLRDAAGVHSRRDGASRAGLAQYRRARRRACWSTRCSGPSWPISSGIRCTPASRPTGSRRSIRRLRSPPRSPPTSRDGTGARQRLADFCLRWAAPVGVVLFALLIVQANTGVLHGLSPRRHRAQRRRRLARTGRRDRGGARCAPVRPACWRRITAPPAGSPSICRRAPAWCSRPSASAGSTCPNRSRRNCPANCCIVDEARPGARSYQTENFAGVERVAEAQRKRGPLRHRNLCARSAARAPRAACSTARRRRNWSRGRSRARRLPHTPSSSAKRGTQYSRAPEIERDVTAYWVAGSSRAMTRYGAEK